MSLKLIALSLFCSAYFLIFNTCPTRITVEVKLFSDIISLYLVPFPKYLRAMELKVSPDLTV